MPDTDDAGFLLSDDTRTTQLACPDCGGGLAEGHLGGISYFRCHVGHQFSPQALEAAQRQNAEAKLWSAVAALEEHAVIARRLASSAPDALDESYEQAGQNSAHTARMLTEHLRRREQDA
jgi:two-component system chemotaxis response regulator CheB